jgi:hypothetical protein
LLNLGALLVKVVFKMLKSIPNRVGALSEAAAVEMKQIVCGRVI